MKPLKIIPFIALVGITLLLNADSMYAQQLPAPAGSAPRPTATPIPTATSVPLPATNARQSTQAPGFINANPHGLPAPAEPGDIPATSATPRPQPTSAPVAAPAPDETVPAKVSVGGIEISGLSDAEALRVLQNELEPKLNDKIALSDGKTDYWRVRRDLGASLPYAKLLNDARALEKTGQSGDIPLRFEVDLQQAIAAMKTLSASVNQKGGTPRLDVQDGKAILINNEIVEMAINGSAWRVKQALESRPPQMRAEMVVARRPVNSNLTPFRYLLAEFSTPFESSNVGRTRNLKMSADNVNGTIVAPGKVFSTNQAIGPRNAAAGWREAKMFVSGQIVDGVGAGICQTATTLYNTALLAGLPIVERHPHSFRVNYAPASRDATIYWGHKDFRFRNDTGGPIYVQTFLRGENFVVRFFGAKPNPREVTVESRILSSNNGTRSEASRTIRTADGEKTELLSRDYYKLPPR